jgi:hypothetical protein
MTKQTKKYLIIAAILIVIAVIAYFVFFKKKKTKIAEETESEKPKASTFPLKKGSKGNEVLNLQKFLNFQTKPPMAPISEDGIFGEETETRLFQIQKTKEMPQMAYYSLVGKYLKSNPIEKTFVSSQQPKTENEINSNIFYPGSANLAII